MTSSARASSVGGMVRPRAVAVLRLFALKLRLVHELSGATQKAYDDREPTALELSGSRTVSKQIIRLKSQLVVRKSRLEADGTGQGRPVQRSNGMAGEKR